MRAEDCQHEPVYLDLYQDHQIVSCEAISYRREFHDEIEACFCANDLVMAPDAPVVRDHRDFRKIFPEAVRQKR